MTTSYPSGIDTFTNPAATDTLASPAHHTQHSDANDAIEAIEAELGINPSGSYTDVVSRLAAFVTNVSGTAPITSTGTTTPTIALSLGSGFTAGATLTLNSSEVRTVVGTGTQNGTTYLRGDGTWATPSGGGTVTNVSGTAPIASTGGATPAISITLGSGLTGGATLTLNSGEARTILYPSGVGTVTNVSGTAPIASTGGATPAISIDAATPSLPGSMSAVDKTKLDTVTAGAKVSNVSGTAPITSTGGATPTVALALGSGFTGGATLTLNSGEARTALGTGTQNNTTYLRGDGTWATAGGTGTVTNVSGTAPINSTLGATPTISLTLGSGLQTVSNALTLSSNETRAIIGTSGTPSATTFLTGDGQWAAAGGASTVGNPLGFTAGDIWSSDAGTNADYAVFTASRLYYVPIWLPTCTVDRIGTEVGGAGTDDYRWGIYSNVAGRPSALLVDAGGYNSTNGVKLITISLAVTAGWYWLAAVHQGGGAHSHLCNKNVGEGPVFNPATGGNMPAESGTVFFRRTVGYYEGSITGTLPANVGTLTNATSNNVPTIVVRLA